MFERYTEKARRLVFFARYEASQVGSPYIETEHLLLGLLREDKALANRFLRSGASIGSIRKQIEERTTVREKVSASVDLPLSQQSKRVLAYAAEEAERLSHKHIGTEHLLLGLLREEKCLAAEILHERGLRLSKVREELARTPQARAASSTQLDKFSRDLTQAAINGELDPLVDREQELEGLIEVLCSRKNNNAVLSGERGVGKTAIVKGLAQRIAGDNVPQELYDKHILELDLQLIVGSTKDTQQFEQQLKGIINELMDSENSIVFVEDLQTLVGAASGSHTLGAADILKPALLARKIQCISATAPSDYQRSIQKVPWFGHCSRIVNVPPLDEENSIRVLFSQKAQYEEFHGVSYTDEALADAVYYSRQYIPDRYLPAKAIDVLDAAGSRVKLRRTSAPEEVIDVQKRIKFVVHRMERAIANHEFERARFYSDEERKERENLRALREKYNLDESSDAVVCREDIEEVVSRWTRVPISAMREERAAGELGRARRAVSPVSSPSAPKGLSLRVFMCHSSDDKAAVRDLYRRLKENQMDPWLDEEDLLPGQDWDYEISNAVRSSHAVIICLSTHSANKAGYLQKEVKKVLDVADEQPEGTIFLIPLRLEERDVPGRLRRWQWVNFFEARGFEKLMQALHARARAVGLAL